METILGQHGVPGLYGGARFSVERSSGFVQRGTSERDTDQLRIRTTTRDGRGNTEACMSWNTCALLRASTRVEQSREVSARSLRRSAKEELDASAHGTVLPIQRGAHQPELC